MVLACEQRLDPQPGLIYASAVLVGERLAGSLALALLALQGGATILRVHDVKETRDVVAVWEAFEKTLRN